MDEKGKTPVLMGMLFGEAAEAAQRGASRRLKRWAAAFEGWLAELRDEFKPATHKQALLTWRRLLGQQHKMPWELRQMDIAQHATWLQEQGYAATTIYNSIGIMANFYRWCDERKIDPACGAGFNPAAGVQRPKIRRYAGAKLLSRGEIQALLETARGDPSPLGKRDYAFILARLRLGVPLSNLQHLQWGQIEVEEGGAYARWRAETERSRLPGEVWEALLDYLGASGRLAGMEAGSYLLAPLAEPFRETAHERAEAWEEGRALSTSQLLGNLKLYGRLAGIAEEKLTLLALRRTATRLKLDEADSAQEMQAFLGSQEEKRFTKYRLKQMPALPADEGAVDGEEPRREPPRRTGKPFKPGEGVKHGLYAREQPLQEVQAVLAENIQGLGEEIEGLQRLGSELVERQARAGSREEVTLLAKAYMLTATRLGVVRRVNKELAKQGGPSQRVEELLAMLDQAAKELGEEPMSEAERVEAMGGRSEMALVFAQMRYTNRNAYKLAVDTQETREYIRYVDLYSSGCVRLARLLKSEPAGSSKEAYMMGMIHEALEELTEELGLRGGDNELTL